jgi:hypothetical protein
MGMALAKLAEEIQRLLLEQMSLQGKPLSQVWVSSFDILVDRMRRIQS